MSRLSQAGLLLTICVVLYCGTAEAQKEKPGDGNPPTSVKEPGQKSDDKKTPGQLTLDEFKLPENALLIICESLDKAQKLIPKGFYIKPEKYQEFMELEARVKQLENQLKPKKLRPYSCALNGEFQGDFIELEANFKLVTTQANSLVSLGCQGSFLLKADLKGQFPLLQYSLTEGYVVQVPEAGTHPLTLFLKVPVKVSRQDSLTGGVERSFTLGLPGAAVTPPLELKLPGKIKEVRWNDLVEKKPIPMGGKTLWKIPLVGEMDKLKISWKEQTTQPGKVATAIANWEVGVQLLKNQVVTTANLTLQDPSGKPADWRLLVPKEALITIKGGEDVYQQTTEKTQESTSIIRIKGPPAQQLEIVVTVDQEKQKNKRFPVGPFIVQSVDRQQGIYEIRAASEVLRGQRIIYHKHMELRRLDIVEDSAKKKPGDVIDRFEAWDLVPGTKLPQPQKAGPINPHFEMELKSQEGQVETWVEHSLRLQPASVGWQLLVVTKIHATPLFGIDFLDVELPTSGASLLWPVLASQAEFPARIGELLLWPGFEGNWLIQPSADYKEYAVNGEGGTVNAYLLPDTEKDRVRRIDLKKIQTTPFTVTLTRKYAVADSVKQLWLELPRPVTLSDKGAKATVEVEDENLELIVPDQGTISLSKQKQQFTTSWPYTPSTMSVAWQPYRAELPVNILADVTFHARHAVVQQQMHFDFSYIRKSVIGQSSAGDTHQVSLKLPPGIRGLKVLGGGEIVTAIPDRHLITIEALEKQPLVLEYDFSLPPGKVNPPKKENEGLDLEDNLTLDVPLLWPEQATSAQTTVRLWSNPGMKVALPSVMQEKELWKDTGIVDVPGKNNFPDLVVQTEGLQPSLNLIVEPAVLPSLASVIAKRALMQVELKEEGKRFFRARYLLTKIDTDALDVQFPLPLNQLNSPIILLDKKKISWKPLGDGKTARLNINPTLYSKPVLLDIGFEMSRTEKYPLQFWHLLLEPPSLEGDVHLEQVRWQFLLPSTQVPLVLGQQAHSPLIWRWQGWLFYPETQTTYSELENWISQDSDQSNNESAGIVFWGSDAGPVQVVLIPRQVWLFLCSGLFLILGLLISFLPLKRLWGWMLVAVLGVGILLAGMFWPGVLPQLFYGIQPGIVVLGVIFLIQWLLHHRYRRQMIFMPGFTRMRTGSSILRQDLPSKREPSTVDQNPPGSNMVGSSRSSQK